MWALARYDLRLTDDEFWTLTPRMFRSLVDRLIYDQDRLDLRAGIIASVIAGAFGGKRDDGSPFTAVDFFPSLDRRRKSDTQPVGKAQQSVEEQMSAMQSWTVVFQQHKLRGNLDESKVPMRLPGKSEILAES